MAGKTLSLLALAAAALLAPARGQAVTYPAAANLFLGPLRNFSLGLVLGVLPGEAVGADDAATAGSLGAFPLGAAQIDAGWAAANLFPVLAPGGGAGAQPALTWSATAAAAAALQWARIGPATAGGSASALFAQEPLLAAGLDLDYAARPFGETLALAAVARSLPAGEGAVLVLVGASGTGKGGRGWVSRAPPSGLGGKNRADPSVGASALPACCCNPALYGRSLADISALDRPWSAAGGAGNGVVDEASALRAVRKRRRS
jgi:hypothetical protein